MTRLGHALQVGARVGLDTALFIYYIEEHPQYLPLVEPVFTAIDMANLTAVTSTITVAEVLIHPLRQNADSLRRQYLDLFLHTANLEVRSIDIDVAENAAELRSRHNIRLPDALQLAVALQSRCDAFVTNDRQLLRIDELTVCVLDDFVESSSTHPNPWQA